MFMILEIYVIIKHLNANFVQGGIARGSGIRTSVSSVGSGSWVDDPITRHIISLQIDKEEGGGFMLWPVVLQKRGGYYVLVLPLVDPQSFRAFESLLKRPDCGSSAKENGNLSSILRSEERRVGKECLL